MQATIRSPDIARIRRRRRTPRKRAGLRATTFHLVTDSVSQSTTAEGVTVPDNSSSDEVATLRYPGGELDLEIVHATEGADGIALGPLLAKTGYTTFDGGFVNTAATKSAITYIDGDAGILRYRGYPIEQLAEKSTFIEVSYLLIYGELPTTEQLENFTTRIQRHTLLHEDLKRFFDGFPRNAHPMPVLSSAVNALERLLPGFAGPVRRRAGRAVDHPAAGQAAHHRGVRLQEVRRPTVPVPGQLAHPGRELPADDVRLPRRALRGRPRGRAGARHAAHPARGPRAELLDVDGAARRLVAGQPVHLDLGWHQRAVGSAARRRKPGGAGDARGHPSTGAATSTSSSARSRTRKTASS